MRNWGGDNAGGGEGGGGTPTWLYCLRGGFFNVSKKEKKKVFFNFYFYFIFLSAVKLVFRFCLRTGFMSFEDKGPDFYEESKPTESCLVRCFRPFLLWWLVVV